MIGLIFAAILHVVVLFDGNHDGIEEGVGPGIPVMVGPYWNAQFAFTNAVSEAKFVVDYDTWYVRAEVPSSRPLFIWVCNDLKAVDSPEEYLVLRCRERFFLRFPFLNGG